MTSSYRTLLALLAVSTFYCVFAIDDDFDFDISDDFEVEFPREDKKTWGTADQTAAVNRVFHLVVTKGNVKDFEHYEAKVDKDKPLPSWLLFDKVDGVFWGIPLEGDVGTTHISIKAVGRSNVETDEFKLTVSQEFKSFQGVDICPPTEDSTVLTLIIDRAVKAIKPKQRVIAINNIAKFFGMPYSAFTLKVQVQPDDITDSSVVLAGPGNLKTRMSKLTSLIDVTVGCEGRLWLKSAPIVHQLKQQARDGTITEVLRLPLVGWRVKTETRSLLRRKREDESVTTGSGDYDEYYEYDDDYDNPNLESEETSSSRTSSTTTTPVTTHSTTSIITSQVSTTTSSVSETHPHRHHHGELRPVDDPLPKQTSEDSGIGTFVTESNSSPKQEATSILSSPRFVPLEETSVSSLQTPVTTSRPVTTIKLTTISSKPTSQLETDATKPVEVTPISGLYKPSETLDSDDEYDEYDEKDDEESETEVPSIRSEIVPVNEVPVSPEIVSDTETTIVDILTSKPTTRITETTSVPSPTTEHFVAPLSTNEETFRPSTTEQSSTATATSEAAFDKITYLEDISTRHSTVRHVPLSTTTQKVTTQEVTEQIEYEVKNFAPTIQIRLNRIAVTAGKNFSQVVPEKMFHDMEDEYNLKLELLDGDGNALKTNSWCQFNSLTREVYGLPLEEDISGWEFLLRATDKEGASVSEKVEIIVQQNKYWRVVNHEFSLFAKIEKKHQFDYPVDWALHILKGIGLTLHSPNTYKITVRRVDYDADPLIFVWTNDSLATNYCPKSDIQELFSMLTSNDEGVPSTALSNDLLPQVRAKKITQTKMGVCEELELPTQPPPTPPIPVLPPSNVIPVQLPSNLPPILRNAVDHINATVGELLVFQVPHDTFYDPEDVDPRNLKLHLYTADKGVIPSSHWLQFDGKNKEFYGIPTSRDARRAQYQLVCEDTGGLTASDTLVVEIRPSPSLNYNLEFSMTIETEFDTFLKNPSMKRKFVEKLKKLFNDDNTNFIHLSSTSRGGRDSTIVTWYNKSLTKEECPWEDIKQLESLLVNNERTISNHVHKIMGDEFIVSAFRIQHLGVCKTLVPITTKIQEIHPVEEGTGATQESHDEYFVTFIVPAVIISTMLLLAAVAACVLYRRRRSGKMNLEEDGRQSYGNKGIPVIFQEELDEKPESGTKAPVILKDEKPPLAPPEYSKSGSLKLGDDSEPYQPPPPFARTQDNGRQARPKPTPTYRKPPPYVPP